MAARRWVWSVARLAPLVLAALAPIAAAQESTTVRAETEITIKAEMPPPRAMCAASVSLQYFQSNTFAKVAGTIAFEGCAAATGEYTIAARIRDESGEVKTLEFNETFRRDGEPTLTRASDYPIGENVELLTVRVRGTRCTCAEQAEE